MNPMLTGHVSKRLTLEYDELRSNFAFKFHLRRYIMTAIQRTCAARGRDRRKVLATS